MQQRQYAAYDLFYDLLLPQIKDEPLPVDERAAAELRALTENLSIQTVPGSASCPTMDRVNGKTYRMDPNPMGIKQLRFDFDGSEGVLSYENARGEKKLRFGLCRQVVDFFPETHYSGRRIGEPKGTPYRCAASAAWDEAGALVLYCYIIDDYFGTLKIAFAFGEESVTMYSSKVAEWFLDDYVGSASGHLI